MDIYVWLTAWCFQLGMSCLKVFNEINSREIEKINIFRGMFSSWIFLGVMVSTVAFQILIVEVLGAFASTVPLSWELWGLSVLIGFVCMPVAVVLKLIPVGKEKPYTAHHDGYEPLPSGPELTWNSNRSKSTKQGICILF